MMVLAVRAQKLDRTGIHACLQGLLQRGRHLPGRQVRGEEDRVRSPGQELGRQAAKVGAGACCGAEICACTHP